ncbi:hypothetical protein [Micromonospora sp. NPDC005203]|uniref:hypothetical protein n=1 Tax=Micromonospora sp. NPDC005203 TaxID=3364226 RepID=UPI00369C1364
MQFAGERSLIFRLTAVEDRLTNHGWVWLSGYELDRHGTAVARREVFVQLAGLWTCRRCRPDGCQELRWARDRLEAYRVTGNRPQRGRTHE